MRRIDEELSKEWLEADGLGGYAMGTAALVRTRRYHALLQIAANPPGDRWVLVNGMEAWLETQDGTVPLTSELYAQETVHPDGFSRQVAFTCDPWPTWTLAAGPVRVTHEIFVPRGKPLVMVSFHAEGLRGDETLCVRPLFSGRDPHCLQRENGTFDFRLEAFAGRLTFRPYPGQPLVHVHTNGVFREEPMWLRQYLYREERRRGLDSLEDLASPGMFRFPLSEGPAVIALSSSAEPVRPNRHEVDVVSLYHELREHERVRRRDLGQGASRAAEAYLVQRGGGRTIIAGYPWFGDWGRDTFISLRGLCLATGRLAEAGEILREWALVVDEGMLPNRFADRGETPEYNSVDASLWYVVAAQEYLQMCATGEPSLDSSHRRVIEGAIGSILEGYARGTRYAIRRDVDGLLFAGQEGVQLTWMDARSQGREVTPRTGKAVEIQALWLNALALSSRQKPHYASWFEEGRRSFQARFWNESTGCLFDVIDVDGKPGHCDGSIRPNQIFAVGGLPIPLWEGDRAASVVRVVEERLWTPMGLRTLDPAHRDYQGRYEGDSSQRDAAYHQGTVWPWLTGAFVQAWVLSRGNTELARAEAARRFLRPLQEHLSHAGLGHVSEIADGDAPYTVRGCPFQAWSVGELIRLERWLSVRA